MSFAEGMAETPNLKLHVGSTNYIASIVKLAIDSARGKGYFIF